MGKKILYAASTFGHLTTFHIPYLEALMEQGYEVHAMGAGSADGLPKGVIPVEMPFEKKMGSVRNFVCACKTALRIRREDYDVISVHTSLAAFFVRLGVMLSGKKPWVINTVHGYLFDEKTSWKKRIPLLLAEKLTCSVTNVVAVMNKQDKKIAEDHKLYKDELVVINGMGIDVKRFERTPEVEKRMEQLRRQYFIGPKDFVMICVAEFSQRKNQEFLLKAMQQLKKEGVSCRLILVGTGEKFERIKSLAVRYSVRQETRFPGYTRDLAPLYYLADASVSASRIEGLPFQIMEAMSCGLPVIASGVKGHVDLVNSSTNGILYEYNDLEGFCEAVRKLSADKQMQERMGQAGQVKVQKYRLEKVLPENMKKLYGKTKTEKEE